MPLRVPELTACPWHRSDLRLALSIESEHCGVTLQSAGPARDVGKKDYLIHVLSSGLATEVADGHLGVLAVRGPTARVVVVVRGCRRDHSGSSGIGGLQEGRDPDHDERNRSRSDCESPNPFHANADPLENRSGNEIQ